MEFKVPQFLDIEDKIFGPFTFKEFVYLTGGAGLCYVLFKLLGLFWGAVPILAVAGVSIALAKYKPNNKPFLDMIQAGFSYLLQSKLYIWKRRERKEKTGEKTAEVSGKNIMNRDTMRLSGGKLRDLAWSLDVLDLSREQGNK